MLYARVQSREVPPKAALPEGKKRSQAPEAFLHFILNKGRDVKHKFYVMKIAEREFS